MGDRLSGREELFYEFSMERFVPDDYILRSVDRFIDLESVRGRLKLYYSETGRPSICPELMIRLLLIGYLFGIRSERRLCEEVHVNLAYRWFCRLGLEGVVPDHSTFSKARHGRFRESDLFRQLFDEVVEMCMAEGLVGGEAFAVDGSLIKADAERRKGPTGEEGLPKGKTSRAITEYLTTLDDAAPGRHSMFSLERNQRLTGRNRPTLSHRRKKWDTFVLILSANFVLKLIKSGAICASAYAFSRDVNRARTRSAAGRPKGEFSVLATSQLF